MVFSIAELRTLPSGDQYYVPSVHQRARLHEVLKVTDVDVDQITPLLLVWEQSIIQLWRRKKRALDKGRLDEPAPRTRAYGKRHAYQFQLHFATEMQLALYPSLRELAFRQFLDDNEAWIISQMHKVGISRREVSKDVFNGTYDELKARIFEIFDRFDPYRGPNFRTFLIKPIFHHCVDRQRQQKRNSFNELDAEVVGDQIPYFSHPLPSVETDVLVHLVYEKAGKRSKAIIGVDIDQAGLAATMGDTRKRLANVTGRSEGEMGRRIRRFRDNCEDLKDELGA